MDLKECSEVLYSWLKEVLSNFRIALLQTHSRRRLCDSEREETKVTSIPSAEVKIVIEESDGNMQVSFSKLHFLKCQTGHTMHSSSKKNLPTKYGGGEIVTAETAKLVCRYKKECCNGDLWSFRTMQLLIFR